MKWTLKVGAAAALFGMSAVSQAGMLGGLFSHHGGNTGCCEDDCCHEPQRPIVARPCEQTYTYQRECSDLRPPCCDSDCCEEPACAAPCDAACAPEACGNGLCGNRKGGLLKGFFKRMKNNSCFGNRKGGLCNHGEDCCEEACVDQCCDNADPCEIATLIYTAQTACYARDRSQAVDDLGDFDCRCHPEVMVALIYSLNDASEKVRAQAADEIGDMLDDNRCCCSPEIVAALTCALGDCDDDVRDQAEEALSICGYDVVEGCCQNGCCNEGCSNVGGNVVAPAVPAQAAPVPTTTAPAPAAPAPAATPAPAPPEDPEAYFPSRYRKQTSRQSGLTNLFGLNK